MSKLIVGVTGKARSGKDTVAMRLATHHNYHHYWFSKPMKEACAIIFGWSDDHLYGELKEVIDERYGVSPRFALQTIGTEWGREIINQDIWLKRAQIEVDKNPMIVISDVRFDNEAQFILDNGGIVLRVVRDNSDSVIEHKSESGVSENLVSMTIENNGTLQQLYADVDYIFGATC